jgi:hypothetical protein
MVKVVNELIDEQVVGVVGADIDGDIPGISSDVEGRVNVILCLARAATGLKPWVAGHSRLRESISKVMRGLLKGSGEPD